MATTKSDVNTGLVQGLGLLNSTTLVAGSMIGSGIFNVSADIALNALRGAGSYRELLDYVMFAVVLFYILTFQRKAETL